VVYRLWEKAAGREPVEHPARTDEAARDAGAARRELARRRDREPDKDWWVTAARVTEWPSETLAW
jgi:hypothetical protein